MPARWSSSRWPGRASPKSRRKARCGPSSSTSCRRSIARLANQESWLRQGWLLLKGQLADPLSRLGDRPAPPGELPPVPGGAPEDRRAARRSRDRLRDPPRGQDAASALHGPRRQRQKGRGGGPHGVASGRHRPRGLRSPDQHAGRPDRRAPARRDPVTSARPGARGALPDAGRREDPGASIPSSRRASRSTSAASRSRSGFC